MQQQQAQGAAAVVVQKAEVPGPLKAFGQDVLQQQPQEVRAAQGAGGGLAALGISVPEGEHAVFAAQDVALGNDPPRTGSVPDSAVRVVLTLNDKMPHHWLRNLNL